MAALYSDTGRELDLDARERFTAAQGNAGRTAKHWLTIRASRINLILSFPDLRTKKKAHLLVSGSILYSCHDSNAKLVAQIYCRVGPWLPSRGPQ